MSISKKLKKGGEARYVIQNAQSGDFFVLPHGFRLKYLGVENQDIPTVPGYVSLGKVPGVSTVATFTVTGPFTSSTNAATWGGGASGTVLASAAVVTLATAASSAAYIAAQSPVLAGYGLPGSWIVTANGAAITMTSTAPFNMTAPTFTVGSSGLTIGSITTTAGSVDATYMASTPLPLSIFDITDISGNIATTYKINASTNGTKLTATFSSTTGAAGSYVLNGKTVSIPNSLTALHTGSVMGGRSVYVNTVTYASGAVFFINGVAITAASDTATTMAAIMAAYIPGWLTFFSGGTLTMIAAQPGPTPMPTIVVGSAITIGTPSIAIVGYLNPGYVTDSATPVAMTITTNGVNGANAMASMNGNYIQVPNTATAAQAAQILAGCAWYQFTVSGTAGAGAPTSINGVSSAAAGGTTAAQAATALATLTGGIVPGWNSVTAATATILMIATTPGQMAVPQIGFATTGLSIGSTTFVQGVALTGYTQTYGATTAVWTGPSPLFRTVIAPTTQTWVRTGAYSGSTGTIVTWPDQLNNVGYPPPSLSGAITTQTYTQSSIAQDIPFYLNFSDLSKVNVYALIEKIN
jgi:hypothetical protein